MPPVQYHQNHFPPKNLDWSRLVPLIGPANAAVARYEGFLHAIPNANVLLAPLTTQEAVLSSKIEGTQATFSEVLEFEAGDGKTGDAAKVADIQEVLNYRAALAHAIKMMDKVPLSQRVIKAAHAVLMQGVRGDSKTPGEYRRVQNWIGPEGSPITSAKFVPPSVAVLGGAMAAWERYLHVPADDALVQLSILHVEFEAIHPFLDGNGRLGRLLVPLFLVHKKMLSSPNFYISAYLESNRDEYYQRLLAVSKENDWTGWCEFFLAAVRAQGERNEQKARTILRLYQKKKDWIVEATNSPYAIRALDWFFGRPIFSTPDFIQRAGIPKATASRIINIAKKKKLLIEIRPPSGRRAAILGFPELLVITEGKEVLKTL